MPGKKQKKIGKKFSNVSLFQCKRRKSETAEIGGCGRKKVKMGRVLAAVNGRAAIAEKISPLLICWLTMLISKLTKNKT